MNTSSNETESEEVIEGQETPKRSKAAAELIDWVKALLPALIVALIFTTVLRPVKVDGRSMLETLQDNDRILVTGINYEPACGDIVVVKFKTEDNEAIVKRIIAVAGQTIDINSETGEVTVDGKVLDEPYISGPTYQRYDGVEFPLTVEEGHVFVMGDNRPVSNDSRSVLIGQISCDDIIGKAILRVYPFKSFGLIE